MIGACPAGFMVPVIFCLVFSDFAYASPAAKRVPAEHYPLLCERIVMHRLAAREALSSRLLPSGGWLFDHACAEAAVDFLQPAGAGIDKEQEPEGHE